MSNRSRYSKEFREEAVKRSLSSNYSIKEVARSLGISYFVLRDWRKKYMEEKDQEIPDRLNKKKEKESDELKYLDQDITNILNLKRRMIIIII